MHPPQSSSLSDPLDVLIIGAGISGIGCACYLRRMCPTKSWTILEGRARLGGTWDLFRYPGVRSDSDLYTFSYDFKPWTDANAIAEGQTILDYLHAAADDYAIKDQIQYQSTVTAADWSSETALWTVTVQDQKDGITRQIKCRWLFGATGYYDYDTGHRPDFKGEDSFKGPILHPQHWPEAFDATGKRIAIIGSGATAVTLVPALAKTAAHVVQIQRTPTYVAPVPKVDSIARWMYRWLPEKLVFSLTRRRHIRFQRLFYLYCQRFPAAARARIRNMNIKALPEGYDVDTHFNPPYNPWDQRLCAVPDGDLFQTLSDGRASIVTGQIDRFTPVGVRMQDGTEVQADVIVTATGLKLKALGGITLRVDGTEIVLSERLIFKGMMLDGVPNFSLAVGYTNASWTLKIGLICTYFCRLLQHMDAHGQAVCKPQRPDEPLEPLPLLDFGAGYVKRSIGAFPAQLARAPWNMTMNYFADARQLRNGPVDDPALKFQPAPTRSVTKDEAA